MNADFVSRKNTAGLLAFLPYIFIFSGLMFLDASDKIVNYFLFVGLFASLVFDKTTIKRNIKHPVFIVLLLTTFYAIFSYLYHGFSSTEIRTLIAASLFLLVFPYQLLTQKKLRYLALLGSICFILSTYYYSSYLGMSRGSWPLNAIPMSTIGAVITLLGLSFLLDSTKWSVRIMGLTTFIFGLAGVLLSESRGVWLALSSGIFIILFIYLRSKRIPFHFIGLGLILLGIISYGLKPQIESRINQSLVDVSKISNGNMDGSFGMRLQLWQISPDLIKQHFLIGSGTQHHRAIFTELHQQKKITPTLYNNSFAHYHNHYIDRWVKNGTIGLLFLLAMIVVPLFYLQGKPLVQQSQIIGVVVTNSIAGLTDVPLGQGASLIMYLTLIIPLTSPTFSKEALT